MSYGATKENREVFYRDDCYNLTVMHYPAMPGIRERGGLQITPDDPESYEILKAECNGTDINPSEELEDILVQKLFDQDCG